MNRAVTTQNSQGHFSFLNTESQIFEDGLATQRFSFNMYHEIYRVRDESD